MKKPKKSKRFLYNLQTLLKVKDIRERQEQDKFNEATKQLLEEEKKEKEIKEYQAQKYEELRDLMSGQIPNLQTITNRQFHLETLKTKVEEQIQKRIQAEEAKEAQRQILVQASREKKVIEKDKEKKKISWKKLMDKEDSKFLDDISSIRFDRKGRE